MYTIGRAPPAKKRTMRRQTHARTVIGFASTVFKRIRRREFMPKPKAVRIIGGAKIATAATAGVTPKTNPANTAGAVMPIKRDMLTTKPVPPATGTVPTATAARVTLPALKRFVRTPGIAPIADTGIRSPTVAQRAGIVLGAETETRSIPFRPKRSVTIRGIA